MPTLPFFSESNNFYLSYEVRRHTKRRTRTPSSWFQAQSVVIIGNRMLWLRSEGHLTLNVRKDMMDVKNLCLLCFSLARQFAAILSHYKSVAAANTISHHVIELVHNFIPPKILFTFGVYTASGVNSQQSHHATGLWQHLTWFCIMPSTFHVISSPYKLNSL